jgi:hypothetical protein
MDRERTRLVAVGQRHQKIGELGVGTVLCDEPFDIVAPAPSARLAEDRELGSRTSAKGTAPLDSFASKLQFVTMG